MKYILVILIFYAVMVSCNEANPRTVKAWINMSDTMVQHRILLEQPLMDSLCKLKSDSFFRIAYDSIFQKRSQEMNLLLDSIPGHGQSH